MNEAFVSLVDYVQGNWPELLWIVTAAGAASYIAGRRPRSRWRKREFLDRLNVTLTSIDDGTMRIRTILEMDCEEIFLNASAAKAIVEPRYESPSHSTRWTTLHKMADQYAKTPYRFLDVEICL